MSTESNTTDKPSKKSRKLPSWLASRKPSAVLVVLAVAVIGSYLIIRSLAATGGSFSVVPATNSVAAGSNFTVTVYEDSGSNPTKSVQADLTYDQNALQFVSIDYSTSAFGTQAESTTGNGVVNMARSSFTDLTGSQVIGVITFKAVSAGTTAVKFDAIAVGTGNGNAIVSSTDNSNLLATQTDGSYTITAPVDTTAPSVPAGLTVANHTVSSIDLNWTASTDDVAVTGYKVYRDGTQVGTTPTASFSDSNLTAGTTYTYTVAAYDAAGNDSAQSSGLQATTDANSGGGGGGGTSSSAAKLYLVPASQSVASGSNLTLNVMVDTGGASVNGVQTTITYPSNQFSYVNLVGDSAFSAFPSPVLGTGSVNFGAGATAAITGVHTVATLTLRATNAGSGNISFQSICTGTSSSTCSAVTDGGANNVLQTITGGTLTVTGTTSGGSGGSSGSTGSTGGTTSKPTTTKPSTSTKSSSTSTRPSTVPAGGTSTVPANSSVPSTSTNPSLTLSGLQITHITDTSATITWQTSLPASSEVDYGTYPHFGLVAQEANLVTDHSVTLSAPNITKGATYAIQVVSHDKAGDAVTSDSEQFSTPGFEVTLKLADNHGKPLSHASVTLAEQTKTSDNNGQVVFENVLAGDQHVLVKAGNKTTKLSIKVGVYDPATKSYKTQQFSLTAARGTNSTPYVIAGLVVAAIVVVFLLLPQLGAGRHWVPTTVKNVDMDLHGMTVGGNSGPVKPQQDQPITPSSNSNNKKPGPPPGSIVGPGN
jgi:chitodextrinase